jgi:hypothetical protein
MVRQPASFTEAELGIFLIQKNRRMRLISLGTIFCLLAISANSRAQHVWLAGIDPVVAADRQRIGMTTSSNGGINDFMDLWKPDAPWVKAASEIQIFKVSTQFLNRSTDEQLSLVINDLRRRHIALAFAAEIMATSAQCGNGVPGYTTRAVIQTAVDRLSRLGGTIDYVAFDSPMAFGHFNILKKPNACQYTTEELVRNIAPQIKILKTAFPNIVFGDVEPVNNHTVTNNPDIRPDDFVFQTWHSYPTRFLPEGQRGTLTSVILQTVGGR